jgi:hypothetical protein
MAESGAPNVLEDTSDLSGALKRIEDDPEGTVFVRGLPLELTDEVSHSLCAWARPRRC